MADEHFIEDILRQASDKKLLKPLSEPDSCSIDTINYANLILYTLLSYHLKAETQEGLSTEEVADQTEIHINTARIYLRVLNRLKFVDSYGIKGHGNKKYHRLR